MRWLVEHRLDAQAVASAWEGESAVEENIGAEAEGSPSSGVEEPRARAEGDPGADGSRGSGELRQDRESP